MKHSIKTQLLVSLIGTVVVMMVLCWGLNSFFLPRFYYQDKEDTLKKSYETISSLAGTYTEQEKMEKELIRMRYADNISFIQVTVDWVFRSVVSRCSSSVEQEDMLLRLKENMLHTDGETTKRTILEETSQYVLQRKTYLSTNTEYMECYGYFEDNSMFMLSLPLGAVKDSAEIANQLLFITCICVMFIAMILISVLTRGIVSPILQLSRLSEKMARLDFEERYEGKLKNEVGILGISINQMADRLKETIDELQSANLTLKKDIEEKIQIDEVRKEFLSNVSHELKTPIALIQGYAEGLQDSVLDDAEGREFYCEVIIDEADKMNKMVKKLLTLNHLEFGQDALAEDIFDIGELLHAVIASNELIAQKKEITFVQDYKEGCYVCADEFKIEEVCTNYLSNAMNHADGSKRITISVEEQLNRYRITVENTGKQIPQEDLERVWIKFFKVDKARTREYGGSGIGLSIVKAIMDAHKMPCGVYNTEDGVAFWFELMKAEEPDMT